MKYKVMWAKFLGCWQVLNLEKTDILSGFASKEDAEEAVKFFGGELVED